MICDEEPRTVSTPESLRAEKWNSEIKYHCSTWLALRIPWKTSCFGQPHTLMTPQSVCLVLFFFTWSQNSTLKYLWQSLHEHLSVLSNSMDLNLSSSVQFSSVAQSCLTLWDPMNHSTPGLPVHHKLLEFTQTHAHRVSDAIQPSHPLSSPSPPAPNPCQHQGLFQRVNSSHEVAKVLEFQHQSF